MKLIIFIFFLLVSFTFAQRVEINSIKDFNRLQIVYNLPDYLNPKIILYTDSLKTTIQNEYETSQILRPKKYFKKTDFHNKWKEAARKPRIEKKNIFEIHSLKNYFITLAQINECCHTTTDILIWKVEKSQILLKALYPYHIGGCLYCGVKLTEIKNDTLFFEVSGGDGGDVYGSNEYYRLDGDKLFKIFVQSFTGFNFEGYYNMFYKNFYYNENEEVVNSTIDFENKINGKDRYAYAKTDSLKLHLITAEYMPYKPKLVKIVSFKNDSIRIGKSISDKVTVLWENEWYITYSKYLKFKK